MGADQVSLLQSFPIGKTHNQSIKINSQLASTYTMDVGEITGSVDEECLIHTCTEMR